MQRLAAGREDVNARRLAQDRGHQAGHRRDDVLASVEHKQHFFVPQRRDQACRGLFPI